MNASFPLQPWDSHNQKLRANVAPADWQNPKPSGLEEAGVLGKVDRAILDGDEDGFVRVHVRKGTDEIVGATIVAAHAGDMIGELSVAMTNKIELGGIGSAIHPYPTRTEAIRKVGDLYSRTRLTPFVKCIFGKWLAWQR